MMGMIKKVFLSHNAPAATRHRSVKERKKDEEMGETVGGA